MIPSRTYRWQGEDLLISVNMTSLSKPDCTRLVPPLSWLSMTGSKVKVLQSTVSSDATEMVQFDDGNPARVIEITVPKPVVESSLSTLRMYGFNRESIFRLLDKGPWVLSFSLTQTLPKIQAALQVESNLLCWRVGDAYFHTVVHRKI